MLCELSLRPPSLPAARTLSKLCRSGYPPLRCALEFIRPLIPLSCHIYLYYYHYDTRVKHGEIGAWQGYFRLKIQ